MSTDPLDLREDIFSTTGCSTRLAETNAPSCPGRVQCAGPELSAKAWVPLHRGVRTPSHAETPLTSPHLTSGFGFVLVSVA